MLDGVSLDVPSGAIFGIIGSLGAGTVKRLEELTSDGVLVNGEPI